MRIENISVANLVKTVLANTINYVNGFSDHEAVEAARMIEQDIGDIEGAKVNVEITETDIIFTIQMPNDKEHIHKLIEDLEKMEFQTSVLPINADEVSVSALKEKKMNTEQTKEAEVKTEPAPAQTQEKKSWVPTALKVAAGIAVVAGTAYAVKRIFFSSETVVIQPTVSE